MLNLTYEHLKETNQAIKDIYDVHEVYENKIKLTLMDGSLSEGARVAKAYDLYQEAVNQSLELTQKLSDEANSSIDKLHDDFIGNAELTLQDAIAIAKEVNNQTASEQYETLKSSAPARKAVSLYEQTMGRGGINDLVQSLEDVFLDVNRDKLQESNELKNASVALEKSFQESLQIVFPDFHTAKQIANSRVEE